MESKIEWSTPNQKKNVEKDATVEEVNQAIENSELTDKQWLFCICYVRCFNARETPCILQGVFLV